MKNDWDLPADCTQRQPRVFEAMRERDRQSEQAEAAFRIDGLAKLREPFPAHQISKLPKPTQKQTDIVKENFKAGIRCTICGGWHHPDVIHLDYVGHAALTDRLLDCDPAWYWEPLSISPEGVPVRDKEGGMWIKLTVCGITRLGYGHAGTKTGGDAIKEIIGDALRNAAMRFGAALDLWHKGDLHIEEDHPKPDVQESFKTVARSDWESLDAATQQWMIDEAMAVTVMLSKDDVEGAYNHIESLGMDDTFRTAFDTRLDSKQRGTIKAYSLIIHAQTLGGLTTTFEAVPQYAKPLLKPYATKRKEYLMNQPEQAAA